MVPVMFSTKREDPNGAQLNSLQTPCMELKNGLQAQFPTLTVLSPEALESECPQPPRKPLYHGALFPVCPAGFWLALSPKVGSISP